MIFLFCFVYNVQTSQATYDIIELMLYSEHANENVNLRFIGSFYRLLFSIDFTKPNEDTKSTFKTPKIQILAIINSMKKIICPDNGVDTNISILLAIFNIIVDTFHRNTMIIENATLSSIDWMCFMKIRYNFNIHMKMVIRKIATLMNLLLGENIISLEMKCCLITTIDLLFVDQYVLSTDKNDIVLLTGSIISRSDVYRRCINVSEYEPVFYNMKHDTLIFHCNFYSYFLSLIGGAIDNMSKRIGTKSQKLKTCLSGKKFYKNKIFIYFLNNLIIRLKNEVSGSSLRKIYVNDDFDAPQKINLILSLNCLLQENLYITFEGKLQLISMIEQYFDELNAINIPSMFHIKEKIEVVNSGRAIRIYKL